MRIRLVSLGAYDTGSEDTIAHEEKGLLVSLNVGNTIYVMQLLLNNPVCKNLLRMQAVAHAQ